jgi:hypothetical protein
MKRLGDTRYRTTRFSAFLAGCKDRDERERRACSVYFALKKIPTLFANSHLAGFEMYGGYVRVHAKSVMQAAQQAPFSAVP